MRAEVNCRVEIPNSRDILHWKSYKEFQARLFLGMTRLLLWPKSTLLLKNKCDCTAIYMKTQCLQTNETQHCLGKENALGAEGGGERVALIKSLIYMRKKIHA